MKDSIQKILIIKLSSLGDVCLALPPIEVITRYHAKAEIWVLTSSAYVDFFKHHPRLNVAVLDRSGFWDEGNTFKAIRWIRRMRFDTLFDLQGNRTSRLLVRFSRTSNRVGNQADSLYTTHPLMPYTRKTRQNIFDRMNEMLVAAGLPQAEPFARLYLPDEDINSVGLWKKTHHLTDGCYVLLHAGSSPEWPSKQWPRDYFARIAVMFENAGLKCVWIGAKEDREINRFLALQAGIDATGAFSLSRLYFLAKGARFGITNDSGPMHVLAVSGLPVYSFFGPTDFVRSHAVGQRERVFSRGLSCSPCFLKKCPSKYRHACLVGIQPEEVFNRVVSAVDISHCKQT